MKPHFHKVPVKLETSYSIRHDVLANFGTLWHYHPELELHYIKKGEGVRFIGDNISNFSDGEMVLLGENLPHTWRCKDKYFEQGSDSNVEAIVIHFLPHCLGYDLLNLPEAYKISKLYERAKKGLVIKGETKEKLSELMSTALHAENLNRLTILLSILSTLAETDEYDTITNTHAFYQSNKVDTDRINKICNYTLSNYKREISLEEISSLSHLSVTSFCRYFKLMTKKTYFDFLTEIRVSHACRMLIEDNLTVETICMESGFNNASNFYRHFKKIIGSTPVKYRSKYLSK
ncbi:AraC-type DNA-binding protein [Pedobacter sp. ok626]|uniref:AraC family transcriptional regulator n=1 Tax=Pedobacter sp. ok626 TaxID=1761882 RepID=UPI0008887E43|nr:AraC family transcriptional regulator [Pedobacter sp. ok626]SDL06421.1 AraC-type DNA-binding protein [Pedobacter sp. ok626]